MHVEQPTADEVIITADGSARGTSSRRGGAAPRSAAPRATAGKTVSSTFRPLAKKTARSASGRTTPRSGSHAAASKAPRSSALQPLAEESWEEGESTPPRASPTRRTSRASASATAEHHHKSSRKLFPNSKGHLAEKRPAAQKALKSPSAAARARARGHAKHNELHHYSRYTSEIIHSHAPRDAEHPRVRKTVMVALDDIIVKFVTDLLRNVAELKATSPESKRAHVRGLRVKPRDILSALYLQLPHNSELRNEIVSEVNRAVAQYNAAA